ncbi:MAG: 30S ribosomal protein S20 [Dehalococcoidia bacterium]
MAHSKSALKRWRQNEKRRARNKPVRTSARTSVVKARETIGTGSAEEAQAAVREAASILDRAAKRHIIHPNSAARRKSRLVRRLNAAGAAGGEADAPKKTRRAAAPKAKSAAKPRAAAKKPAARGRASSKDA